jgi:23S rRNA (adenine2503-C2)-methyltransferase
MYQFDMKKNNLIGLNESEIVNIVEDLGDKSFRGRQLYHEIYQRREEHLTQMAVLPKVVRTRLENSFEIRIPKIQDRQQSKDGTIKFLFRLDDGKCIESVFIPEDHRQTLCISSQVGCGVGCTFCMTARMGFHRNLTSGEILGQVLAIARDGCLTQLGFNVVFMGMGEPLYNYKNVMKAFRIMTDSKAMGLSHRKITVSTAGVVPAINRMQSEMKMPNLAISLNAANDDVRHEIMPINQKWSLKDLLDACRSFSSQLQHRITFEYVLLSGITDSDQDAQQLVKLLEGLKIKVNLIPYNPDSFLPFKRPGPNRVERFQSILIRGSVSAFVRKTRGDDISAACGQLAHLKKAIHE